MGRERDLWSGVGAHIYRFQVSLCLQVLVQLLDAPASKHQLSLLALEPNMACQLYAFVLDQPAKVVRTVFQVSFMVNGQLSG